MLTDINQLLLEQQSIENFPHENSQSDLNKTTKQNETINQIFKIMKVSDNMTEKNNQISPFSTERWKVLNIPKAEFNMIAFEMEEILKKEVYDYINPGNKEEARLERRKKIERYREKKNRRCWGRSVVYDCRRHAAKLRNRVHGRFAGKTIERKKSDLHTESNKIFSAPPMLWKPIFAFCRTERPARKFE